MAAQPGTAAYGGFSVLVQARCGVEVLARVRAGSFVPPPKVESAFVGLRFGPPPCAASEWRGFKETVRAAFGARRKTLRNSLGVAWGRDAAESVLAAAGLPGNARAEALGQDAFVRLARARASLLGLLGAS
jgi:16S rRNA (adenine1518-N6/adenine1519-N6)-dimethyltransferase